MALQALGEEPGFDVTFLGVTKRFTDCQEGARIHSHAPHGVRFECLEPQHFIPEVRTSSSWSVLLHLVTSLLDMPLVCETTQYSYWHTSCQGLEPSQVTATDA